MPSSGETPIPGPHYKTCHFEAIDVIEDWGLGFCLGNTVKYLARLGKKPGATVLADLRKARWYIDREIARLEADEKASAQGDPAGWICPSLLCGSCKTRMRAIGKSVCVECRRKKVDGSSDPTRETAP